MRDQETGDIVETLAEAESMRHKIQSTHGTDGGGAVVATPRVLFWFWSCQGPAWGTACGVHGKSTPLWLFVYLKFCINKVYFILRMVTAGYVTDLVGFFLNFITLYCVFMCVRERN